MTTPCTGFDPTFGLSRRQALTRFGGGLGGIDPCLPAREK